MPMYEYRCQDCHHSFDMLRRLSQNDADILCPHCGEQHIQRKLSVFAAFSRSGEGSSATTTPVAASGGSCGGGCAGCACGSHN